MSVAASATVNAFHLKWSSRRPVYHYDVEITPLWQSPRPIKIGSEKGNELLVRLQTNVAPQLFTHMGAYDGKKNLYSYHNYGFPVQQFDVAFNEPQSSQAHPKRVRIKVAYVREVNTRILETLTSQPGNGTTNPAILATNSDVWSALNMLNLFIQSQPRRGGNLFKANSFYTPTRPSDLSVRPLQLWRGFFQSVRPTIGGLLLNVDVTLGAVMPETPLESACLQHLRLRDRRELTRLLPQQANSLRVFLRGMRVVINLPNHRNKKAKIIRDLIPSVGEVEFSKEGQLTTIREHFYQTYNVRIDRDGLGVRVGRTEIFPASVCVLKLQLYKSRLSPEGVSDMMSATPRDPTQRMKQILGGWSQLGHESSEFLRGAGVTVSATPLAVQGHILNPPMMGFAGLQHQLNKPGVWDVMRKKLYRPCHVTNLLPVNFTGGPATPVMGEFVQDLRDAMSQLGIQVTHVEKIHGGNPNEAEELLGLWGQQTTPNVIIILLPENGGELYTRVKRFGDITVGVATQCVRWSGKIHRNYSKSGCNQYHNNLILKINAKLGGISCIPLTPAMDFLRKVPTMIIGADVSHPGPNSMMPSIASVVASMDNNLCRYCAEISVQRSRQEMIQDLQPMLVSLLNTFIQRNSIRDKASGNIVQLVPPQRIIFFRDGVSEGEFETVRQKELNGALQDALMKVYKANKLARPKVSFIIVGKRHHFRFFPDQSSTDGRTGNCKSGFVVQRGINHPVYSDFYLQSQSGLKGTSIPAHYTVLQDEVVGNTENLQQIAYTLCHCYARATRSVKIPAPVYYADLVCSRAKNHFPPDVQFSDDVSVGSSGNDPEALLAYYKGTFRQVQARMKEVMYFV